MNTFAIQSLGLSQEDEGPATEASAENVMAPSAAMAVSIIEDEMQQDAETLRLLSSGMNSVCNLTITAEELMEKSPEATLSPETAILIAGQMETIMSDLGITRDVAADQGMSFSTEDGEPSESVLKRMKDFIIRMFEATAKTFSRLWYSFKEWLYETFDTLPRYKAYIESLKEKAMKLKGDGKSSSDAKQLVAEIGKFRKLSDAVLGSYVPSVKKLFTALGDVTNKFEAATDVVKIEGKSYKIFNPLFDVIQDMNEKLDIGTAFLGHEFKRGELSFKQMNALYAKTDVTDSDFLHAISAAIPELTKDKGKDFMVDKDISLDKADIISLCDSMAATVENMYRSKGSLKELVAQSTRSQDVLNRNLEAVKKNFSLFNKARVGMYKIYLNFINKPWNKPVISMNKLMHHSFGRICNACRTSIQEFKESATA